MSRAWPRICFGQIVVLVPAAMEELDEATPRSARRRASRQLAANVPGLRASGP